MGTHVVMLGAPGAGKGTQAERFARARAIPKISTGDILRDAVQAGTDIGRRVAAVMDRGQLVIDDVVIGIVSERLEQPDTRKGFVLDGFPRTVAQASALDAMMEGREPLIVVNIFVPEPELMRRLGGRLICVACGATAKGGVETSARCARCGGTLKQRSDDDDGVVRERLKVYHRDTRPLVDYYGARPTFRSIDGAQPADRVAADLAAAIEAARRDGMGAVPHSGAIR